MTRPFIYLDHSATTPVDPAVLAAMLPYFTEQFGNPSSIHAAGRRAAVALQMARQTMAGLLGCRPGELVFTGSGTEGDNMALRGIALARRKATGANRILISAVEHKAVLETAEFLAAEHGFALAQLPVDAQGMVALDAVAHELEDAATVALVSVMAANNEIGTLLPVHEIGALCRKAGVPFHCDAVQAAGYLPLHMGELAVDALTLSAHKFYGPKGVGLLYMRSGTPFQPQTTGGSQEGGRRAATENVAGAVGLAAAFEEAERRRSADAARLQLLRDRLIAQVLAAVAGAVLTGSPTARLPHHASFLIQGVEAEGILIGLDLAGIAASSGSACTSAAQRPSHVLEAIGVAPRDATGGLRFSLGRSTNDAAIDYVVATLVQVVERIRAG